MKVRAIVPACMVGIMIGIPNLAYGYLDPGTGSVALQVVLAGVLGALFTIKSFYQRIRGSVVRVIKGPANSKQRPRP